MPIILQTGYEEAVRAKLGVKTGELPDSVINQRLIVDLAEMTIKKRVPDFASITLPEELLVLEGAVISYMCYLLAPSMSRRLNQEVSTMDVKWKKGKVDWDELAILYLSEVETALTYITSVVVDGGGDSQLLDVIRRERVPL